MFNQSCQSKCVDVKKQILESLLMECSTSFNDVREGGQVRGVNREQVGNIF